KHADRLTYLIEDLLTISKLESGQLAMNRSEFNLHTLVQHVASDLASKAAEKKTLVDNRVDPSLTMLGDIDRFEEVFVNLLENSIKYGVVGGHVTISAKRGHGVTEVSVSDDGPGIPPEARDRVFERFYRVDRARSRDAGG